MLRTFIYLVFIAVLIIGGIVKTEHVRAAALFNSVFEPKAQATPSHVAQVVAAASPLYASSATRDQTGRIIVPVMVNDQGPFRFVLDTGANRSVLATHMIARLGLAPSAQTSTVELGGVTGQATVPTVSVRRLQAGALLIENLDMPVIEATMAGLDGVLGVDGLENKRLTIDFVHDQVSIEQSNNQRATVGYVVLRARFRHGLLLVADATVGDVKASAVIDTGANATLATERLRRDLQRLASQGRAVGSARVEGVTADVQSGDILYGPKILFDRAEISGVKIAYGDFYVFRLWGLENQPALLVGMDVLGTVDTLIIDYRRRELQIKPRSGVLLPRM